MLRERLGAATPPDSEPNGGLAEVVTGFPGVLERELQEPREPGMLDDHDRQIRRPRDRILHREHREAFVDDDQLERQVVDNPRLFARLAEPPPGTADPP